MAARFLEVAVILSAVDRMSATVRSATGGAAAGYQQLLNTKERADAALRSGLVMGAGAAAGVAVLNKFTDAYGEAQEASLDLASAMLRPGGILDDGMLSRINQFAVTMSGRYAGAQKDYIEMVRIMKQNRIKPEDVLGGIGEPVAQLAELFKMAPGGIGLFASRMRNDMRITNAEMGKMVDLLARLQNAGVGTNGPEAVSEMTEFFSKAGLGASNLGLTGLQNAKDLAALGGIFMAKGLSGATVGTALRRIFDNIADPKKLAKMNEEAAKLGIHLKFFDKQHHILGIPNLERQIGLLTKFNSDQQAMVLDPFGGKQGLGLDFMKQLALFGTHDIDAFNSSLWDQAMLQQRVGKQQEGYNQQTRITHAQITNLTATIGRSYNPAMTSLMKTTGEAANVLTHFFSHHQNIAATSAAIVATGVGVLSLAGAISIAKAALLYSGVAGTASGMVGWFGSLGSWVALRGGILGVQGAIAALTSPVGILVAALGALALIDSQVPWEKLYPTANRRGVGLHGEGLAKPSFNLKESIRKENERKQHNWEIEKAAINKSAALPNMVINYYGGEIKTAADAGEVKRIMDDHAETLVRKVGEHWKRVGFGKQP